MVLTDTHTHLYYETDAEKRKQMMDRCFQNGISRLFLPNVNMASVPLMRQLMDEYPGNCFPMLGLHPCEVGEDYEEELRLIQEAGSEMDICAVGEIGIDLYWDKSTLAIQQQAFRMQIDWAKALNLPIVIHCREAFDEVCSILVEKKDERLRGIFHCFTGTLEQAEKVMDLGFYIGIGGVVTFKNSGLDKVVAELFLENIVLETDSPYLAPVPFRGKPNESSFLKYTAEKVAGIKKVTLEELAEITTKNSKSIFGI